MHTDHCKDYESGSTCQKWKENGHCERDGARAACPKTCGMCGK